MHFNNIIYWLFCALCVAQSPGGPQVGLSGWTQQLQPGGLWLPGANDDDNQSVSDSTDTSDDDCYSLDEEEKSFPDHRFEKR